MDLSAVTAKAKTLVHRAQDQHIRLAVTGLSGSGKTAFITSLVQQLTERATLTNLPFFSPIQQNRWYGAKLMPQPELAIASFPYPQNMAAFLQQPPSWPKSTERLSTLRIALRYRPDAGLLAKFQEKRTLYLDIIDYPGEWLLDLPLLDWQFTEFADYQWQLLQQAPRLAMAEAWLAEIEAIDWLQPQPEAVLDQLAERYHQLLMRFKTELGLLQIQPGRAIMPGEWQGAPMLLFFPLPEHALQGPAAQVLAQRYQAYCEHVVRPFYQQQFKRFDRQIVLVDVLSALNQGQEQVKEVGQALALVLSHFDYGQAGLLKRLFAGRIDKLVLAASKADHVTADQHNNLVRLLDDWLAQAKQQVQYEGIAIETLALASVKTSEQGEVQHQGQRHPCLRGTLKGQTEPCTLYPGDVPAALTDINWAAQHFDYPQFQLNQPSAVLPHIRLDHALEVLLGDKMQ